MALTRGQQWSFYFLTAGMTDSAHESKSQFRLDLEAAIGNSQPPFTSEFIAVANATFTLNLTPADFVDVYGNQVDLNSFGASDIRIFVGLAIYYPPPGGPCLTTVAGNDIYQHLTADPPFINDKASNYVMRIVKSVHSMDNQSGHKG